MLINIVSRIPWSLWEREVPPGVEYSFIHTEEPVKADGDALSEDTVFEP